MTIDLNMPEATYHARPELSSTQARNLLKAPAIYLREKNAPPTTKPEFDLGTSVHSKVLGVGAGVSVYPDDVLAKNGAASTNAAKEWAEQARLDGLIPLKRDDFEQVNSMAEAVLADAGYLFEQDGHPEASLFATDPETGVDLRARFDFFAPVGVDLKTTGKVATPWKWALTVYDLGYDVQQEHYRHIRSLIEGEKRRFIFVAVETDPPYLVGLYELNEHFEEMGAKKARKARHIYAACSEADVWPRYSKDIQLIGPPPSAVYDFQDNYS